MLFVNFTGYACTNCHWMKANMFPRPEIAAVMKDFVLVELYTDGTDEASKLNQDLELAKFNTVAIPLYAILDADEKVIATSAGLTKDPREYLAFLQKGTTPGAPATASAVDAAAPSALPQGLAKLDGGAVEGLAGKVVVVNFWATWCVPCIQEIPSFNKLHQTYAARGVTVVGVSMDEDGPEKVKRFLARHPMEYAVAMGSEKISQQFKLEQLPVTVVFDRSGNVLQRFEGFTSEAALHQAIEKSL